MVRERNRTGPLATLTLWRRRPAQRHLTVVPRLTDTPGTPLDLTNQLSPTAIVLVAASAEAAAAAAAMRAANASTYSLRIRRTMVPPRRGPGAAVRRVPPRSVLVGVEHVPARHRHAERSQRVLHADRVAVGGEHVRKPLVDLRRLVRAAAHHDDALLSQALLHLWPVDHSGPNDPLRPDLAHLATRMLGARLALVGLGRYGERAVALAALVDGAPLHAARRLRAAHHPARAMHGRVEGVFRLGRLGALEDHGVLPH